MSNAHPLHAYPIPTCGEVQQTLCGVKHTEFTLQCEGVPLFGAPVVHCAGKGVLSVGDLRRVALGTGEVITREYRRQHRRGGRRVRLEQADLVTLLVAVSRRLCLCLCLCLGASLKERLGAGHRRVIARGGGREKAGGRGRTGQSTALQGASVCVGASLHRLYLIQHAVGLRVCVLGVREERGRWGDGRRKEEGRKGVKRLLVSLESAFACRQTDEE